ncbi:NAD(P)H-dependent oxidoreductase [Massilia solisilvae]|uniref:NAD(P)H-dependent oxidoreductase n=1 Tax=Massilia solisilvae TaxID=1811225 RepID=A0ABT2BKJ5_9BURK|nr:NADPH-dependent FMN reductase [Massilia solisilvae]MCS0609032.1 NAD(P)H-dependent oxidoreductase [Massilia solisilvae]
MKNSVILAVSGSLRAASYNTAALRAAQQVAPPWAEVRLFDGIGALPLFNPDLDNAAPEPVTAWRTALAEADAVLIASPEYAHGVTGVLKNALDWVVSMQHLPGKRVALLNTSPRAYHAQESLREILRTMCLRLVPEASIDLPLQGSRMGVNGILARPDMVQALRGAVEVLAAP